MGRFAQAIVVQYLDDMDEKCVRRSAESLLSAFLESVGAGRVECDEEDCSVEDAPKRLADVMLTLIDPDDDMFDFAAKGLSMTLSGEGVSFGASFRIDKDMNAKNRWELFLHERPFPRLDLRTYQSSGFRGGVDWAKRLASSQHVGVVWIERRFVLTKGRSYGKGDAQYLFWRRRCSQFSSSVVSKDFPKEAWTALCEVCHQVSNHLQAGKDELVAVERRQERYVADFERAIFERIGEARFREIVGALGIDLAGK